EEIEPVITNDTYGWLLTVYKPVLDADGHCVCYAAADISMHELESEVRGFIAKMLSLFAGFFAMVVSVGLWFADFNMILPVNTIATVANDFAYNSTEERDKSVLRVRDMDIRTGDEIENLYHAILKLASDSMRQVEQITEKNDLINRMQNSMILVLAEMVESRDANTGQHVRKTAAYVEIIMDQLKKEGIFVEDLTDEFIQDVINSAPLHDIGKITIPDAILNKPGRLDDEEFAIMRSHAAAGRDIISDIIEMVPDSKFLREARNLAAHHHERWDGKGYPDRLSGEEIPLSARIMAVADVFDALVSTRSYKKGFPFEKAMDIIREGVGTQFDPQVAEAFIHASDRVREVAESFGEVYETQNNLTKS
ncbi:MAG: HD domain-containing protein, partial [Lachnospiraceae bacterium]|nr:HD domain-containing protein [Lachnospiraceae bacterium]